MNKLVLTNIIILPLFLISFQIKGQQTNNKYDILMKDGVVISSDSIKKYCIESYSKYNYQNSNALKVSNEDLDFCFCFFNKVLTEITSKMWLEYSIKISSFNNPEISAINIYDDFKGDVDECIYEISNDTMSIDFRNNSFFDEEHRYVNNKLLNWKIKGEFEKTKDYKERLSSSYEKMKEYYSKRFIQEKLNFFYNNLTGKDFELGSYNADEEFFPLVINTTSKLYSNKLQLQVKIDDARLFKSKFWSLKIKEYNNEENLISSLENLYDITPHKKDHKITKEGRLVRIGHTNSWWTIANNEELTKADIIMEIDLNQNAFFVDIVPVYYNYQIHIKEINFYYISSNLSNDFYFFQGQPDNTELKVYYVDDKNSEKTLKEIFSNFTFKKWSYLSKEIQ